MLRDRLPQRGTSSLDLPAIVAMIQDFLLSKNKSPRTGKAWARQFIKINFKGLEYRPESKITRRLPSLISQQAGSALEFKDSNSDIIHAVIVAEAVLAKSMPPGLDLMKQRVDRDIAFDPDSGSFAFRIYVKVGESSIPALTERLRQVEQLFDFIEVVKRHENVLHCEKISLGELVFSYGQKSSLAGSEATNAMVLNEESDSYRARISFGEANSSMSIKFETNNPHLRIIDHLGRILNSKDLGLNSVARMLSTTLYVMKALVAIELSWAPLTEQGQGEVLILSRAADWHIIRYTLPPTQQDQNERKFALVIKLEHRRRIGWWCIKRNVEQRSSGSQAAAGDEIDAVLKAVWDRNEPEQNWRGMSTGAIAQPDCAMDMLITVDAAVRQYAANFTAEHISSIPTETANPLPQPQSQQQARNQQQQQQQVRPQNVNQRQQLQRQQQSMGRNTNQPVVIDLD